MTTYEVKIDRVGPEHRWKLKRGETIACQMPNTDEGKKALENLRRTDERFKGAILSNVLQFKPEEVPCGQFYKPSGSLINEFIGDRERMFALLSNQGTAMAESAICGVCIRTEANTDHVRKETNERAKDMTGSAWGKTFTDCSENEALTCNICGRSNA